MLNTKSLDGLRAITMMHIVIGCQSINGTWTGGEANHSEGFDFMGGISMGLFYIISGFVLMVGYGSDDVAPNTSEVCSCCCCLFDVYFARFCTSAKVLAAISSAGARDLSTRPFFWKRFARMGPLWHFGIILATPLFFTNYIEIWEPRLFWWVGVGLVLPPVGLNIWLMVFPPAPHVWTMSTMTLFYLVFPCLRSRIRRIEQHNLRCFALVLYGIQVVQMLVTAVAAGFLFGGEAGYWFARVWPLNRLSVFIMGLCAARQCHVEALGPRSWLDGRDAGKLSKVILHGGIFCSVIFGGIAMQVMHPPLGISLRFAGEVLLPMVFYELIVGLAYPASAWVPPSPLHAILGNHFMRFVVDISIAVYVVHETLVWSLAPVSRGPAERGSEGGVEIIGTSLPFYLFRYA